MNWREVLKKEMDRTYRVTERLIDMVDEDQLGWKPSQENNWMSMGQLLRHTADSCGMTFRGFVTGDWGLPEGLDFSDMKPEDMLPPAEKMPTVESVAEAKDILARDEKMANEMLEQCSDEDLDSKITTAPWDPGNQMNLGHHLLQMIEHFRQHKGQLFYYLKLQGKPVSTHHLW